MAENVTIQVGGQSRHASADEIDLRQPDSDALSQWIPEAAVPRGKLRAAENGTYAAALEDVYAYDEIEVSVGSAGGYVSVGNTMICVDDDGDLQEELLPDHIKVASRPNHEQAGFVYHDGDSIDAAGLACSIYNADGSLWENENYPLSVLMYSGEIVLSNTDHPVSIGELSIEPTVADASQEVSSDLDTSPLEQPIPVSSSIMAVTTPEEVHGKVYRAGAEFTCEVVTGGIETQKNNFWAVMASKTPGNFQQIVYTFNDTDGTQTRTVIGTTELNHSFTYDGKTVYYTLAQWGLLREIDTISINAGTRYSSNLAYLAWTICYGTGAGGTQTITVSWPRYGDGKILTTSFEVRVTSNPDEADHYEVIR